jgi:dTDP-4-amino-4,6-dideoxy-D-glucose acyltransferase
MGGLNGDFLSRRTLEALGFAKLGEDVRIHSTAVIADCSKVSIGSRVRIDPFVIISATGGITLGDNIHVGGHSAISGQGAVRIEDFVTISHYVGIFTTSDDMRGTWSQATMRASSSGARTASINFGRHSMVGAGSLILPGAQFAEGSVLGAMSRISRPMRPWTTYAGIPARRMNERRRSRLIQEQEYLASPGEPQLKPFE